jgi:hypothetical protein
MEKVKLLEQLQKAIVMWKKQDERNMSLYKESHYDQEFAPIYSACYTAFAASVFYAVTGEHLDTFYHRLEKYPYPKTGRRIGWDDGGFIGDQINEVVVYQADKRNVNDWANTIKVLYDKAIAQERALLPKKAKRAKRK